MYLGHQFHASIAEAYRKEIYNFTEEAKTPAQKSIEAKGSVEKSQENNCDSKRAAIAKVVKNEDLDIFTDEEVEEIYEALGLAPLAVAAAGALAKGAADAVKGAVKSGVGAAKAVTKSVVNAGSKQNQTEEVKEEETPARKSLSLSKGCGCEDKKNCECKDKKASAASAYYTDKEEIEVGEPAAEGGAVSEECECEEQPISFRKFRHNKRNADKKQTNKEIAIKARKIAEREKQEYQEQLAAREAERLEEEIRELVRAEILAEEKAQAENEAFLEAIEIKLRHILPVFSINEAVAVLVQNAEELGYNVSHEQATDFVWDLEETILSELSDFGSHPDIAGNTDMQRKAREFQARKRRREAEKATASAPKSTTTASSSTGGKSGGLAGGALAKQASSAPKSTAVTTTSKPQSSGVTTSAKPASSTASSSQKSYTRTPEKKEYVPGPCPSGSTRNLATGRCVQTDATKEANKRKERSGLGKTAMNVARKVGSAALRSGAGQYQKPSGPGSSYGDPKGSNAGLT